MFVKKLGRTNLEGEDGAGEAGFWFHWPDIDVDLAVEMIEHPERVPLKARVGQPVPIVGAFLGWFRACPDNPWIGEGP